MDGPGVANLELTDGGELEVVAPLARLDERNRPLGVADGDREARKAGPGAEIRERAKSRRGGGKGEGVEDEAPGDLLGGAVAGEIDPPGPAGDQLGERREPLDELPGGPGRPELGEPTPDQLAELVGAERHRSPWNARRPQPSLRAASSE
jgi:hypothetical protein